MPAAGAAAPGAARLARNEVHLHGSVQTAARPPRWSYARVVEDLIHFYCRSIKPRMASEQLFKRRVRINESGMRGLSLLTGVLAPLPLRNSLWSETFLFLRRLPKCHMNTDRALRAIANARRLQILEWLRAPRKHFPPQVDGDLVKDGVCGVLIAQKLGVTHPTLSEHLKVLSQAGLIRGRRIKQWTFYKRDEARIRN